MKRALCPHCRYPQSVCICDLLCKVASCQQIIILQHPSESNHAKNTARIIQLCVSNSKVIVGETPQDFMAVRNQVNQSDRAACVLYPNQDSIAMESLDSTQRQVMNTLILIDATWRKAYKIWQLNPWLHCLPSWHFGAPPASQYAIRKTKVTAGLSTLEALAHTLYLTQKIDKGPLLTTFKDMQNRVFAKHKGSCDTSG